jgi:MFS family permease
MSRATTRLRAGVLGLRDFRLLFIGQTVSTVGDQIFPVAVTIAVLNSTGNDAGSVGLVLAARWVALVLFVLLGGVWADRLPRRAVMMGSDAFRMLAVLGLALLPGSPPVWVLAALVFLVGGGEAFFRPAYGALVPGVVPADRRPAANALTSVSLRTAAVVGPGVGAALVTLVGVRTAFFVDALTFLISLLTLLRLKEPSYEPAPSHSMLADIREGFTEVWRQRWATAVLGVAALQLMLAVAPGIVLLPIIGRREFGGDAVYGTALSLFSLGGVIGAMAAMRFRPRHPGLVGVLGLLPYALVPASLLTPFAPWWIFACHFVAGLCLEPFIVYWTSALQRAFPAHQLARVTSIDWLCSFALMPVGLALVGPAAAGLGEATVLWTAITVAVVPVLLLLLVPGMKDFRDPRSRVPVVAGPPTEVVPVAETGTAVPRPRDPAEPAARDR